MSNERSPQRRFRPLGGAKHPQPSIRPSGTPFYLHRRSLHRLPDPGNSARRCLRDEFRVNQVTIIIIIIVLIITRVFSEGLWNCTRRPLFNCSLQLWQAEEPWLLTLSSQSLCTKTQAAAVWILLRVPELLLRWCDRWLMGGCTTVRGWSTSVKRRLAQKMTILSSKHQTRTVGAYDQDNGEINK